MPRARFAVPFVLFAFTVLTSTASSQTTAAACPAPPSILTSTRPNIFSEQQEQWLGDAMADAIETDYKPVKDASTNAYLESIATRLLGALPPTKIHFRVLLVESSEINGFSLAGGRVYLTRKLVANAHSEDEIAGVIAHEIGHILTHQFAEETTADMKRLLGVTSVTDRADIYTKFQQLIDARQKRHSSTGGDTDEKQDEADRVSVYATAAAGYRPQAYSEFWDRVFYTNGNVGSKFSDFFGATKPESKRLRAILKLVTAIPPGCGATSNSASAEFLQWQQRVIANQTVTAIITTPPATEVQLTPPLHMSLQRLNFSRDGKSILAQDESSVFVLSRDPYKLLFRFDTEDALPARFSPDSQSIVFQTPRLHTEQWSVRNQKLIAAHEPVARHDCLQSELSPDGRTIACLSWGDYGNNLNLSLLEAESGQVIFEKKPFFQPTLFYAIMVTMNRSMGIPREMLPLSFSADGNTLVVGPDDSKLAFDLRTRTPIKIGGDLKNRVSGAYAFLGNDKLAGINLQDPTKSGIFSFPDGQQLKKIKLSFPTLESVSNGENVLVDLTGDFAVGVVDLTTEKLILRAKTPAVDLWGGQMLSEGRDGSVLLGEVADAKHIVSLPLPLSPLGRLSAASLSPDGKYLALSNRSRGAVWDVATGKQLFVVRAFTQSAFHDDDTLLAEFPKLDKTDRTVVRISPTARTSIPTTYKETDDTAMLAGNLFEWKTKDKKAPELIAHDLNTNAILWSRVFEHNGPAYTTNFGGPEIIFSWLANSPAGKAELKGQAALASQAAAIKNKDSARVIEIIDNLTGKVLQEAVVEVPEEYVGVGGVNRVDDLLYVTSEDNRTAVYSLATAKQLRQLFGHIVAADPASRRICTTNRRDEVVVYDSLGAELSHFNLGSPIRFAEFRQNGAQLILLTADQRLRTMKIDPPSSTLAKP
jgi:WD40 repeat protein